MANMDYSKVVNGLAKAGEQGQCATGINDLEPESWVEGVFTKVKNHHIDLDVETGAHGGYRIAILADPQFGFWGPVTKDCKEVVHLKRAVKGIMDQDVAAIIIVGDLTHTLPNCEAGKKKRKQEVGQLREVLSSVRGKVPILTMPGNHDILDVPNADVVADWEEDFGDTYYSFKIGNVGYVVLNASWLKTPDAMPKKSAEQMAWLHKTLQNFTDTKVRHVVMMCHWPFYYGAIDEKDYEPEDTIWIPAIKCNCPLAKQQIPASVRVPLYKLFKEHNVKFTFHGHTHYTSIRKTENITQTTYCAVGRPLFWDPAGYGIIHVDNNNFNPQFYPIAPPPDYHNGQAADYRTDPPTTT